MPRFSKGTMDHDGDGRIGGSRKESDMKKQTKTAAKPKTATKVDASPASKTEEANTLKSFPSGQDDEAVKQAAYDQGREARRGCIARLDAPHGDGPLLTAWQAGYDYEDGILG